MRYMLLIYTRETEDGPSPEEVASLKAAYWEVIDDAARKGVLLGAEPLARTATATTVRIDNGRVLITDGPFAETKEQLAGYYMLDCENLDEAIEWAARIPAGSKGREGSVEIRPMPGLPPRSEARAPATRNG
ncbi:MAG: YciI family protein [Bryobacteraceae bacterium]|jgi:hypothetical protein